MKDLKGASLRVGGRQLLPAAAPLLPHCGPEIRWEANDLSATHHRSEWRRCQWVKEEMDARDNSVVRVAGSNDWLELSCKENSGITPSFWLGSPGA